MRAEERHKMQQNELAEWLGKWIERLKPYSNLMLVVAVAVVVGVGAGVWLVRQSAADRSQAWNGFYRALSSGVPEAMAEVAAQHPRTDVGQWASVLAGDVHLASGCQQLFGNKAEAGSALRQALEHYEKVRRESKVPALLERATFGQARAYEALAGTRQSQGELDKAIEAYQEILDKWPNGAYRELAARRLDELQQHETRAFYDKFAQFDPRPALPDVPALPGGPPAFDMDSLSEDVDLSKDLDFLGPPESPAPDKSDTQAAPTGEASSSPADAEPASAAPAGSPPEPAETTPEPRPAPGPAVSDEMPGQDTGEPEEPPVEGSAESDEASARGQIGPKSSPAMP